MKCPNCETRCSELRDVCAHCFKDLREHKTQTGVTVTFPHLEFEKLIEKYNLGKHYAEFLALSKGESLHTEPTPPPPAEMASENELQEITTELKVVEEDVIKNSPAYLFKEARKELENLAPHSEIDLGSARAYSIKDRETIRALFQILIDEVRGETPVAEATPMISSADRTLESEVLKERLEEVEESVAQVASAPEKLSDFVAKQKILGSNGETSRELSAKRESLTDPTIIRRVTACCIDWLVTLLITWVGLVIYDHFAEKGYFIALVSQNYDLIDWRSFAIHALIALGLASPMYSVMAYLINKSTVGENMCNLTVKSWKSGRKTRGGLLLRGLLLPLYIFIIPSLSRLFSARTLIDWLSGTIVKREIEDLEPDSQESY